ncbi:hypothetical protein RJT34_07322 [Clitoria ternatea]|uniref:Uncharacterized protein n=1 Tax=Clitoria ternatea TaxID=43366 RepID=A0AAN9K4Z0_CLITE
MISNRRRMWTNKKPGQDVNKRRPESSFLRISCLFGELVMEMKLWKTGTIKMVISRTVEGIIQLLLPIDQQLGPPRRDKEDGSERPPVGKENGEEKAANGHRSTERTEKRGEWRQMEEEKKNGGNEIVNARAKKNAEADHRGTTLKQITKGIA